MKYNAVLRNAPSYVSVVNHSHHLPGGTRTEKEWAFKMKPTAAPLFSICLWLGGRYAEVNTGQDKARAGGWRGSR